MSYSFNPETSNSPTWMKQAKIHIHDHTYPKRKNDADTRKWTDAILKIRPDFVIVGVDWNAEDTQRDKNIFKELQAAGIKVLPYLGFEGWTSEEGRKRDRYKIGSFQNMVRYCVNTLELDGIYTDGLVWLYWAPGSTGENPFLNQSDFDEIRNIIKNSGENKVWVGASDIFYLHRYYMVNDWILHHGPDVLDWEHYNEDYLEIMLKLGQDQFHNYERGWELISYLESKPVHPRWICGNCRLRGDRELSNFYPDWREKTPGWISIWMSQGFSVWMSDAGWDDFFVNPDFIINIYLGITPPPPPPPPDEIKAGCVFQFLVASLGLGASMLPYLRLFRDRVLPGGVTKSYYVLSRHILSGVNV